MSRQKSAAAALAAVAAAPPDVSNVVEPAYGPRFGYKQAARYLGVKEGTLRALVSRKQVPHVRLSGRLVVFDRDALDAHLKANSIGGGER